MIEKIAPLVATAMIVAGCETAESHGFDLPGYLGGPEVVNVHVLPDQLPEDVTGQLPNVVAYTHKVETGDGFHVINCSGVRVSRSAYLTAGHCTEDPMPGQTPLTDDTSISVPRGIAGESFAVSAYAFSFSNNSQISSDPSRKTSDMMLVRTNTDDSPNEPPTTYAQSTSVKAGTPLYAANYEPTEDHTHSRNPYVNELTKDDLASGYNKPAIFGAIALSPAVNGFIEAIAGLKSYSQPPETVLREGASGGPVYDGKGRLVGISTAIVLPTNDNFRTVGDFETEYDIDINLPKDAPANVFVIHPVDAKTVADFQTCIDDGNAC
jgi:hypothetical protein